MLQFNCKQKFRVRDELGSPPAVAVIVIGLDVPLPWVAGLDSNNLDTVVR